MGVGDGLGLGKGSTEFASAFVGSLLGPRYGPATPLGSVPTFCAKSSHPDATHSLILISESIVILDQLGTDWYLVCKR